MKEEEWGLIFDLNVIVGVKKYKWVECLFFYLYELNLFWKCVVFFNR